MCVSLHVSTGNLFSFHILYMYMQMLFSSVYVSLCAISCVLHCAFDKGELSQRTSFHILNIHLWLLSSVCPCVYDQVTFLAKTLSTFCTYKLVFHVCPCVSNQVTLCSKFLSTCYTSNSLQPSCSTCS